MNEGENGIEKGRQKKEKKESSQRSKARNHVSQNTALLRGRRRGGRTIIKREQRRRNKERRRRGGTRRNYSALIRRCTQAFNTESASYGELTLFHGCITEPSYFIGMHVVGYKQSCVERLTWKIQTF